MAVTGCDFVCKNEECKHKDCGIVLTSPWPLGNIDDILNSSKVANNDSFKKDLEELKKQGRKYACICLPDAENIKIVGYRVHMWCENCPCDWTYDAMIPDKVEGDIIQAAIKNANIPENCPTCNHKLKNFIELISKYGEGIKCTSCKTKLSVKVWFCNETGTEEKTSPFIKIIGVN